MNTISYHIKGITTSLLQLAKGNYLVFFIPGAIITGIYWWLMQYTDSLQESYMLSSEYSWVNWTFGWFFDWANSGTEKVFEILDFLSRQVYIFIILTALSPFNTLLGEKLDGKFTGKTYKTSIVRFLNDLIRMIFVIFIALLLEFTCIILYWLASKGLGLEVLDPLIYFCISAFFFGFTFYDFAFERYSQGLFDTLTFAFYKPLTMLLTGTLFLAIYKIPIVGIPISPVITVMVSTIVYLYITKKLPKQNTELNTQNDE